ncbi:putative nmra-like family protein [Lasiodiplodia theobromae]|uniref:Uncharacterized protein n=1 Tax=Lasiodiplodia theobromae TaxID=45133 RepID=A0A5N5DD21_9PEZI|nr:hypothetical protein DBV05_g5999 [Lasiodiplodia theobromae]KAF9639235.1 putative nmra-like family protein [Lasiodiplodia theobromae]
MNLVRAAHASTSTKRFISNNWGIPVPGASYRNAAVEEVKKTGLQWTLFFNGYLMDYFGTPRLKSHMPGPPPFVNVANKVAAIPGSGNEPVIFHVTYDSFENFDRFGTKEQRAKFFAIIGLIMVAGDWDLPSKTSLNVKFPNIKPLSARKILEQA